MQTKLIFYLFLVLSLKLCPQNLTTLHTQQSIIQEVQNPVSCENDKQIGRIYQPFDVQEHNSSVTSIKKTSPKDFETIRFAVDFGLGIRTTGPINQFTHDEQEITEGLRSGLTWSVNGDFYFNKTYGLGLKALFFETHKNFDRYFFYLSGQSYSENIEQSSSTFFVGPEFIVRIFTSERKNILWTGVSLGYINYFQSTLSDNKNIFNVSGTGFGVCLDIGYDVRIFKKIGLGIGMHYVFGAPSEYTFQNEKGLSYIISQPKENLGRFGITLGFRFYN